VRIWSGSKETREALRRLGDELGSDTGAEHDKDADR
jgi:hypothetical protein